MRTLVCVITMVLVFSMTGVTSVQSQTQMLDGYTLIRGASGTVVCLGRWIPSKDVALPGTCEGQVVDIAQLTAISSRLTADRLDQILFALSSLDQKLAINNDQIRQLIEVTNKTQTSIDEQVSQVSDLLREQINTRFNALPKSMLASDLFKKEIEKLKEDILKEVEKHYSKRPTPSAK
jgi:Glu-tRNA(Gln) amidotransferase subunit E-like FAD-binding protein